MDDQVNKQTVEGRGKRGTQFAAPAPAPAEEGEAKTRMLRGTVIDRDILSGDNRAVSEPVKGYVDESGRPVSTADRVPDRVKFPARRSIIQQIFLKPASDKPPSADTEPNKTALKSFNRGSIKIDRDEFQRIFPFDCKNGPSGEEQRNFLADSYGLSEVMTRRLQSHCSKTFSVKVLLDNGSGLEKEDGMCIEGKIKNARGMKLADDKRLANNTDRYNLSVKVTERFTEVQDLSIFLVHLAATMALPTTFELFSKGYNLGGMGRAFRRLETPQGDDKQTAEDYIPVGDQVESALELIEDFPSLIGCMESYNAFELIQGVKKYYDDKLLEIEKQGKDILVIIMIAKYPWGCGDDDLPESKEKFAAMMNGFADLPVTFVFIVESREKDVIKFYDELISPESSIKANVKVAKGLGLMVEGVSKSNPWLNYCLPMHLCQALGICSNILSLAASRPLCAAEVRELCNTLIGEVPDPGDADKFMDAIKVLMLNKEHIKWNPSTGKDAPLIDTAKLKKHLNRRATLISLSVAVLVCILAIIVGRLSGHLSFSD